MTADSQSQATCPVPQPVKAGDHVYLIDGSTYIFRAYFAMFKAAQARGRSFTRSDGTPVGAVMTFSNMLWKILREGIDDGKPTHLAVIFDHSGETFRNALYHQYKANRDAPPDELVPQFPLIRDAVRAFGLLPIEKQGFEADDLIATYACHAVEAGAHVTIVSGDKDLMQIVGPSVSMYDPMPGNERRIGEDEVRAKFGVGPDKVVDVQSLCGDATDNVPGVPGIGVKTAAQLIQEYGDLDTLLANAASIKQNMRRERLLQYADQARLSRELVRLKTDVPLDVPLAETCLGEVEPRALLSFMRLMEFTTLTKRVATAFGVDIPGAAEIETPAQHDAALAQPVKTETDAGNMPAAYAARRKAEIRAIPFDISAYETVTTLDRLAEWIAMAVEQGYVAFDSETTGLDPMKCNIAGFSLALAPGRACYVPIDHRPATDGLDLDNTGAIAQAPKKEALALLKGLLEDEGVLKIGQNLKYDIQVLRRCGIEIAPVDDTMLMSYALDAGMGSHGMDELSQRHLGHKPIAFKDVCGSGKSQVTFDRVPVARATEYAAEDADVTLRLWHILSPRLAAEGMAAVYERLERPMIHVLADMEGAGVRIDPALLKTLSVKFTDALADIEKEVHELAGEKFNVGSTKQLSEILFGKLGYPGGKKTGTGVWSTGATVLDDLANSENLAEEARRLPVKLLEWRQLSKLKSTYTDTLPAHIHPETGRIHTCYSLASTSTGRLASTEPNLQNIPIRTAEGRQIRMAFIAEPGHKLISADYSQIELRVLAHVADIPALKAAFAEDLDIHAMTASEMFGVPIKDMPGEVRRRAKAINFGIIYGISAFGLAQNLSISRSEAGDYITKYFERFPGIRAYMEATKATARDKGYVTTVFGRKIHFPDITSSNRAMRSFFERAAINAPIQGTAADIIRRAMVKMAGELRTAGVETRMLLQVHDELVFEAKDADVEMTIATAKRVMERAAEPAAMLSVPLRVDARAADNWDEAH
ncbi:MULTISPECIES: DNA polymerase I [Rhodomicrobium]|uniref:DNA polymerase I n=1 Tax=Rhodomicrobium TaxID=1068 RepID=UPI001FD93B17|nr:MULTISPECIES: DNA polymerase I [Rhodomicrobium]